MGQYDNLTDAQLDQMLMQGAPKAPTPGKIRWVEFSIILGSFEIAHS